MPLLSNTVITPKAVSRIMVPFVAALGCAGSRLSSALPSPAKSAVTVAVVARTAAGTTRLAPPAAAVTRGCGLPATVRRFTTRPGMARARPAG